MQCRHALLPPLTDKPAVPTWWPEAMPARPTAFAVAVTVYALGWQGLGLPPAWKCHLTWWKWAAAVARARLFLLRKVTWSRIWVKKAPAPSDSFPSSSAVMLFVGKHWFPRKSLQEPSLCSPLSTKPKGNSEICLASVRKPTQQQCEMNLSQETGAPSQLQALGSSRHIVVSPCLQS